MVTYNDQLADLQGLEALVIVGGGLEVSDNLELATGSFAGLATVGRDFDVHENSVLATIDAPALQSVRDLLVTRTTASSLWRWRPWPSWTASCASAATPPCPPVLSKRSSTSARSPGR